MAMLPAEGDATIDLEVQRAPCTTPPDDLQQNAQAFLDHYGEKQLIQQLESQTCHNHRLQLLASAREDAFKLMGAFSSIHTASAAVNNLRLAVLKVLQEVSWLSKQHGLARKGLVESAWDKHCAVLLGLIDQPAIQQAGTSKGSPNQETSQQAAVTAITAAQVLVNSSYLLRLSAQHYTALAADLLPLWRCAALSNAQKLQAAALLHTCHQRSAAITPVALQLGAPNIIFQLTALVVACHAQLQQALEQLRSTAAGDADACGADREHQQAQATTGEGLRSLLRLSYSAAQLQQQRQHLDDATVLLSRLMDQPVKPQPQRTLHAALGAVLQQLALPAMGWSDGEPGYDISAEREHREARQALATNICSSTILLEALEDLAESCPDQEQVGSFAQSMHLDVLLHALHGLRSCQLVVNECAAGPEWYVLMRCLYCLIELLLASALLSPWEIA